MFKAKPTRTKLKRRGAFAWTGARSKSPKTLTMVRARLPLLEAFMTWVPAAAVIAVLIVILIAVSLRIAKEYERGVVFRLGRLPARSRSCSGFI